MAAPYLSWTTDDQENAGIPTLTVLEFFAVGDLFPAVLFRAVNGDVSLQLSKNIYNFQGSSSLFLWLYFFIGHLTLPLVSLSAYSTIL